MIGTPYQQSLPVLMRSDRQILPMAAMNQRSHCQLTLVPCCCRTILLSAFSYRSTVTWTAWRSLGSVQPFSPHPRSLVSAKFVSDELMKPRLTWVLLSCSFIVLAGCTRLTNMMTFNGVSEIPPLTEPDLDDD